MLDINTNRREFLKNAGRLSVGASFGMGSLSRAAISYASSVPRTIKVAQKLKKVEMLTLGAPSNSTYFLALIKEKGFDKKHGVDFDVGYYSDVGALYSDFVAGKLLFTPSSAIYNAASFYTKGIPIQLLFTYSTANHTVVTRNPAIKTTQDLKGKTIAATPGPGFYGFTFLHFMENGINPRKDINVISASPSAVRTQLEADKVEAGVVWEPNVSILVMKGFRIVGNVNVDVRKSLGMLKDVPIWFLGAYAWKRWIDEDPERAIATYRVYKEAEKFFNENQAESIEIISKFTKIPKEVLKFSSERKFVEFAVIPAIQVKKNIMKTLEGYLKVGFMEKMPDDELFYAWPGPKT